MVPGNGFDEFVFDVRLSSNIADGVHVAAGGAFVDEHLSGTVFIRRAGVESIVAALLVLDV